MEKKEKKKHTEQAGKKTRKINFDLSLQKCLAIALLF